MPDPRFDPPWNERVKFDPAGGFAYVPNTAYFRDSIVDEDFVNDLRAEGESFAFEHGLAHGFAAIRGTYDAIRVVAQLRAKGVDAQPDHVLFAHGMTCCCCGPHPATGCDPMFLANPLHANPLHANPLHANPLHANPLHANPLHANAADPNGPIRSSARPAEAPPWYSVTPRAGASGPSTGTPKVVVIDTGIAGTTDLPEFLRQARGVGAAGNANVDVADENSDQWLDPAAGHGTFIAGIIERIAPGCAVDVIKVLGPQGAGSESEVVAAIDTVAANRQDPPAFLNLSFGGYVWEQAPMLSAAVLNAQQRGIVVVASAGNDGTCRPSFPAAIPGVVSVGAIGPWGPAWFSNYGDWVRACAPGVDVVSSFFASFDGKEPPSGGRDIDNFRSWATWSGTSFAAPAVVGALVREMRASNCTPTQAVDRLIDAPWLGRIPGLGTVVNV
ncbi:MAG: S8 family serine peptidase [Ilumatobacteraceae bacterium]